MAVVRAATVADAPALATVAAATFALACPPHVTQGAIATFIADVLSVQRFEEYLGDPSRDLFVAEEEGLVGRDGSVGGRPAAGPVGGLTAATGYAMLVTAEPADPDVRAVLQLRPTSELSKIYVLPDQHGAGTSRELMAAALDAARARGSRGAWLGVNQLNERAQRFYAKSGFTRVGTKRFLVGDRYEDDYVFEQAL
ncbi:GNAT family N-acetyltransferase [Pedococcus sp. KACC 23699]|uniref:GNAT family N-acetyltransferase n=1 Tax=Pedococcus sp. KACC 23699 TaxID=3149228 RepID=A0AAU7JTV0_9MICO